MKKIVALASAYSSTSQKPIKFFDALPNEGFSISGNGTSISPFIITLTPTTETIHSIYFKILKGGTLNYTMTANTIGSSAWNLYENFSNNIASVTDSGTLSGSIAVSATTNPDPLYYPYVFYLCGDSAPSGDNLTASLYIT